MIFLRRRIKLWTPDSLVWIVCAACLLKGTWHRCVVYPDLTVNRNQLTLHIYYKDFLVMTFMIFYL